MIPVHQNNFQPLALWFWPDPDLRSRSSECLCFLTIEVFVKLSFNDRTKVSLWSVAGCSTGGVQSLSSPCGCWFVGRTFFLLLFDFISLASDAKPVVFVFYHLMGSEVQEFRQNANRWEKHSNRPSEIFLVSVKNTDWLPARSREDESPPYVTRANPEQHTLSVQIPNVPPSSQRPDEQQLWTVPHRATRGGGLMILQPSVV